MKTLKKVLGCLRKADNDYNLINNGDRICVGISGGKDSSILLYCLNLYKMFSKKDFEVIGVHLNLGFSEENIEPLRLFFEELNIPFYYHSSQIYDILKLHLDSDNKIQCSLCSKLRRGAIINIAKEYGCNKIAFGHHSDDAVETLFLNMIHGGRIATFQPIMFLERSETTFIRPLLYAYENDIDKLAIELNIPIMPSGCPNDKHTQRQEIKEMLHQIYHKYPGSKDNFQLMLRNQKQLLLFNPKEEEKNSSI